MDVGENTTGSDGNSSEELVQLFIVLDGKSDVAGHDTALLVVTGCVSGKLEDLGTEVLEDSGEVNRGASSHTGGVLALTEVTADTTDGELKTSLGRSSGGLLLSAATLSFSRHVDVSLFVVEECKVFRRLVLWQSWGSRLVQRTIEEIQKKAH